MMVLLIKALHIAAVMTWVGGMLLQAFLLRTVARQSLPFMPEERSMIGAAVRWDRKLIAPAMLLAWACGLALASRGGWWGAAWLIPKIILVIGLSALHGYQSGSLRRMVGETPRRPSMHLRHAIVALACCVAGIVLLVVVKPGWE